MRSLHTCRIAHKQTATEHTALKNTKKEQKARMIFPPSFVACFIFINYCFPFLVTCNSELSYFIDLPNNDVPRIRMNGYQRLCTGPNLTISPHSISCITFLEIIIMCKDSKYTAKQFLVESFLILGLYDKQALLLKSILALTSLGNSF